MNKMNPLLKLIYFLTIGTLVFFTNTLTGLVIILMPIITIFITSDLNGRTFFATFKVTLTLFTFGLFIYGFIADSGSILYGMGDIPIYQSSYQIAGLFAIRIGIILLSGTLFAKTTKDTDIAHAFTYLIYPLKYIKVPVDRIGTTLAISIKFIPEFTHETKQIVLAKKLRTNHLSKWAIGNRMTLFLGMFTPLFVLVFKKAVSTYNAMYIAGYDLTTKKTKYKRYSLNSVDLAGFIFIAALMVIAILLHTGYLLPILDYTGYSSI